MINSDIKGKMEMSSSNLQLIGILTHLPWKLYLNAHSYIIRLIMCNMCFKYVLFFLLVVVQVVDLIEQIILSLSRRPNRTKYLDLYI